MCNHSSLDPVARCLFVVCSFMASKYRLIWEKNEVGLSLENAIDEDQPGGEPLSPDKQFWEDLNFEEKYILKGAVETNSMEANSLEMEQRLDRIFVSSPLSIDWFL